MQTPYLTTEAVAQLFAVANKTASGWAKAHLVPGVIMVGQEWRWPQSSVDWIKANGVSRRRRNLRVARGRKTY